MKAFLKWLSTRFPSSLVQVEQHHKQFGNSNELITKYRCYVSDYEIFKWYDDARNSWSNEVDTIAELKFEVNQYLKVKKEEELKANNDE